MPLICSSQWVLGFLLHRAQYAAGLLFAVLDIFLTRRWCGDGDMCSSRPGSAPCAPNSVALLVQPVRASLRIRPAEAPKVAHIPITAPAAALCGLARSLARSWCLAFLRRPQQVQKKYCARPARPASRGCSDFGPSIGDGCWISDLMRGLRRNTVNKGTNARIKKAHHHG